jgi:hypothetical protein
LHSLKIYLELPLEIVKSKLLVSKLASIVYDYMEGERLKEARNRESCSITAYIWVSLTYGLLHFGDQVKKKGPLEFLGQGC